MLVILVNKMVDKVFKMKCVVYLELMFLFERKIIYVILSENE